jgi:uncharacterized membrane protein
MTLVDIIGACLGVGILVTCAVIAILQEQEKQERDQGGEREVKGGKSE